MTNVEFIHLGGDSKTKVVCIKSLVAFQEEQANAQRTGVPSNL